MAIKVTKKKILLKADVDAARNEAKVLKKLKHPNVLPCIDMFEYPSLITTVFPLMKQTLRQYLDKREKRLSEEEAIDIFKMIVNGVNHCHKNGIMHCDLKPNSFGEIDAK